MVKYSILNKRKEYINMDNIGTNIKFIRKEKKLTLQDISNVTDLSLGYLSKLERNLSSPNIVNLHKICKALGITMTELMSQLEGTKTVVKKEERRVIFESESHVRYEMTTEGNRNLNGVCMIVDDNSIKTSYKHNTDEFGIIIKGKMEITINDIAHILDVGDSIYIEAETEHSFKKLSDEKCISYWTYEGSKGNRLTKK
jgi:transcriptional regulator with XRE-family HTH domain